MNARVERYRLEPEVESEQGVGIKSPYTASFTGPQPDQPPYVPPELLDYLRKRFPNRLTPQNSNPHAALLSLHLAWGRQEVIDHLGSLLQQTEK